LLQLLTAGFGTDFPSARQPTADHLNEADQQVAARLTHAIGSFTGSTDSGVTTSTLCAIECCAEN